jgi:hypothetical protein
MSCDRHRSAIRDVALGEAPSRRLEDHLCSCPACRAVFDDDRRRLVGIDGELKDALAVEPSVALLPRVREAAAHGVKRQGPGRIAWLVPLAASVVALAILLPLARRGSPPSPGVPRAAPSARVSAAAPPVHTAEAPAAQGGVRTRKEPRGVRPALTHGRPGRTGGAQSTDEPEVLVPPGGEAALRRFVAAIRDRRLGSELVLSAGPGPVDWMPVEGASEWPRPLDRLPAEAYRVNTAPEIVPRTLSEWAVW